MNDKETWKHKRRETVEIPPVTDCQASPENTTATTDRLTGVYETKAREYAMSLTGTGTHEAG